VGTESAAGPAAGSRLKKHYAVQLGFYTDILERMGMSAGRLPFIWDVHGDEVIYDLSTPLSTRSCGSLWEYYRKCLDRAQRLLVLEDSSSPALSSTCTLCHWRSFCLGRLIESDDLSLIPELGRSKRDVLYPHVKTTAGLAAMDIQPLIRGPKTVLRGVGADRLRTFQLRARLLNSRDATPILKSAPLFPRARYELFFDIETDPLRDVCYLHGFVERTNGDSASERYVPFFSDSPDGDGERRAFAEAWGFLLSRGVDCGGADGCVLYYYSKYERTWWYRLQSRYPEVASREQIEGMFAPGRAVDLYSDVVRPCTEWPTRDYSIKTLAGYLGFRWRDAHPSGAASIEWYNRWVEKREVSVKERILQYNEDDCRATRFLLDGITTMSGTKTS
jgi:predicted RecB family nuclease